MAKKKVFQISDALTEGLEETISAAHHFSGELSVDVIPIKRIKVDPDNPRDLLLNFDDLYNGLSESDHQYERKSKELDDLQTIANSIRHQGIINPIVVYKHDEHYRLVAGERRTLASILAGKAEIQAKILDGKPSQLKISLLQWIENVERSDLTLWERLRNLEKIMAAHTSSKGISAEQVTITELSHLLGCTKPHAMNYKSVLMSDWNLKQLIQDNKIKNLEKAALISNITDPITQQQAINVCLMGASLKKLKLMTRENKIKKHKLVQINKRGRQATSVNFGTTKNLKTAKVILSALLQNEKLSHLQSQFQDIAWNDYKSLTEAFKFLLIKLEELHTQE